MVARCWIEDDAFDVTNVGNHLSAEKNGTGDAEKKNPIVVGMRI